MRPLVAVGHLRQRIDDARDAVEGGARHAQRRKAERPAHALDLVHRAEPAERALVNEATHARDQIILVQTELGGDGGKRPRNDREPFLQAVDYGAVQLIHALLHRRSARRAA